MTNETLIRAGIVSVLLGVAILLSVWASVLDQRRERAQVRRRLYHLRDGYRYRPPRPRTRHHGATALGLLAAINKHRRGS